MHHWVGYNENVLNGLDVGKGMVGVNGKVLPGCFKYVGWVEVPLYPVETVRRVELEPLSVTRVLDTGVGFSRL